MSNLDCMLVAPCFNFRVVLKVHSLSFNCGNCITPSLAPLHPCKSTPVLRGRRFLDSPESDDLRTGLRERDTLNDSVRSTSSTKVGCLYGFFNSLVERITAKWAFRYSNQLIFTWRIDIAVGAYKLFSALILLHQQIPNEKRLKIYGPWSIIKSPTSGNYPPRNEHRHQPNHFHAFSTINASTSNGGQARKQRQ